MTTSNICIGIISWFPDNEHRAERVRRCRALIERCDELFNIPIVVIAQNWRDEITSPNLRRSDYPKLGITNARKILWERFKNGSFDWMICFDDDGVLEGVKADAERLLQFLSGQSGGYVCSRLYEFKLCAFHKNLALSVGIPDLDVEQGTGIEDLGFFKMLEKVLPEGRLPYDFGSLRDARYWAGDETSSWRRSGISGLLQRTNRYVENIEK